MRIPKRERRLEKGGDPQRAAPSDEAEKKKKVWDVCRIKRRKEG